MAPVPPETLVAAEPGGTLRSPAGDWLIAGQAEPPPRQVFRRVLHIVLPGPPPGAEAARVAEGGAELRGAFHPLVYDALDPPDAALTAALEEAPEGPVAVLDAPRRVVSIGVAGTGPQEALEVFAGRGRGGRAGRRGSAGELSLHRIDGQAVSPMPTVTGAVHAGAARFGEPFVADRFAVRGALPPGARAPGRADLRSLRVTSPVTGPRIGLADPAAPSAAASFWRGAPSPGSETVAVQAGAELARALEAHLTGRLAGGGSTVEVALVIEADVPCRLALEAFGVAVTWRVRSFADGGGKRVLRPTGPGRVAEAPALSVPAGGRVVRSALTIDASLGPERLAEGRELETEALDARRGALVTTECWVGVPVARGSALVATGVGVPVLGLARGAAVRIELHADAGGVPAGAPLAAVEVAARPAGVVRWHHPGFPEPVAVSTAPHWLLARASRGSALWLARPGGPPPARFESPSPPAAWRRLGGGGDASPLFRFTSAANALREAPGVELAIGGRPAPGMHQPDGTVLFDLAAPLEAFLALAGAEVGEVPLELSAGAGGIVTVYPPEIELSLGEA